MTNERARANQAGLPELLKYISDVQDVACRLHGVMKAIDYLDEEDECRSGRIALIHVAEELAAKINTDLDFINLPKVAL
ncbi:MAG: hypothetical protein AAF496_08035 [Pseudomonadota bacterium]